MLFGQYMIIRYLASTWTPSHRVIEGLGLSSGNQSEQDSSHEDEPVETLHDTPKPIATVKSEGTAPESI